MSANNISGPTTLYRHFDAEGVLLYVGISLQHLSRLSAHARKSHWIGLSTKVTMERFPTRAEAHKAERKAIRDERPIHNVVRYEAIDEPGAGICFLPPLGTEARSALLSRLAGLPEGKRVPFSQLVPLLGLNAATTRRIVDWVPNQKPVLEYAEAMELGYRVAEGTAVLNPSGPEQSNLSYPLAWAIRLFGRRSPLVARAQAVASGAYDEAAKILPSLPLPHRGSLNTGRAG